MSKPNYGRLVAKILDEMEHTPQGPALSMNNLVVAVNTLEALGSPERKRACAELVAVAQYFWKQNATHAGDQMIIIMIHGVGKELALQMMEAAGVDTTKAKRLLEKHTNDGLSRADKPRAMGVGLRRK